MRAKVKPVGINTCIMTATGAYQVFFPYKAKYIGKVVDVEFVESEDAYYDGKSWWAKEWLDFSPEATQPTLEEMREKEPKPKREAKIINTEENPETLALLAELENIPKPKENENQEKLFQ